MIREGKDVFAALDIAQYQRYTFSMYSGDVQRVTMRFRNTMMNADIDKFGKLGYIKEVDKAHFEVTASPLRSAHSSLAGCLAWEIMLRLSDLKMSKRR